MSVQIRGFFLVLFIAIAAVGCKASPKKSDALEGGEIKYAISGMDRGRLEYAAGVRPQDAGAIGEWLRDKGWFVTRPEKESAISGKAKGSYGLGAAGRGQGTPLAKVARRGRGLEVIVYADARDAESTDVAEFGAESADELMKKLSKPVRFVIRSERKKGQGLEWVDAYWDSRDDSPESDQVARSNGR